ncbi:hypothetical protein [Streptacidiphilus sp. MAP5-3]|uniref:hypothetical protein n=1 Tax=unclassified Streptacidiphilus TaxID=2643834 RepID=UPI003518EB79
MAATTHRVRSAALLAVGSAVLAGSVLAGTGTAYAKSGAYVSAGTPVLRIGQSAQVTASGGDDAVRYTYLCLDERAGGSGWHVLGCAAQPWHDYTRSVRATSRGAEQFRARLLARRTPTGPLWVDRVSGTVTVLVH